MKTQIISSDRRSPSYKIKCLLYSLPVSKSCNLNFFVLLVQTVQEQMGKLGGKKGNKNMEFNQPPATVFSTTVLDSHMGNGAIKGFYTVISN